MTPAFRKALTRWYHDNARDLPWRNRPTPYRVWVSEIMLQQTRVEFVREYFTRFMKRFPTIRKLAAATEEEVLEAWSGLGYYRRARMLRSAAKRIVDQHGGRFPSTRAEVLELPGVGRYTAGAILSIAFKRAEPIVDGNIERVFARLHAYPDNVKAKPGQTFVWDASTEHVVKGNKEGHAPSDLNQALMELGATVCKPAPDCGTCPVRRWCAALKTETIDQLPILPTRAKAKRKRYLFVALLDNTGRILMVKRKQGDRTSLLPSGMWELPHTEWNKSKLRVLQQIEAAHNLTLSARGKPATRAHAIMDYRLTLAVQKCEGDAASSGKWFTPAAARQAAIASATRKLLDVVQV